MAVKVVGLPTGVCSLFPHDHFLQGHISSMIGFAYCHNYLPAFILPGMGKEFVIRR